MKLKGDSALSLTVEILIFLMLPALFLKPGAFSCPQERPCLCFAETAVSPPLIINRLYEREQFGNLAFSGYIAPDIFTPDTVSGLDIGDMAVKSCKS